MYDEQRDLFDDLDVRERVATTRKDEIDGDCHAFLDANPEVWRLLVKYTHELIARGWKNYGIAAVVERIRWHHAISSPETDFKINNNYRAPLARMFHAAYPEHDGFFRTRERISEKR